MLAGTVDTASPPTEASPGVVVEVLDNMNTLKKQNIVLFKNLCLEIYLQSVVSNAGYIMLCFYFLVSDTILEVLF